MPQRTNEISFSKEELKEILERKEGRKFKFIKLSHTGVRCIVNGN